MLIAAVLTGLCLGFAYYALRPRRGVTFTWAAPKAADFEWKGERVEKLRVDVEKGKIQAYAPATGELLGVVDALSAEEITRRIDAASTAQKKWKNTSFEERRRVLQSLLEWVVRDMDKIAQVACRDTGKTLVDASFGEILTTCEKLRWMISKGEGYLRPDWRGTNVLMAHKVSKVHYEPLGVVGAIVSWNYSFHNALGPIIAALFTGNGIVVKPSEHVVWSTQAYVDGVRACLEACGHDADIVQVVPCYADAVEALTTSPLVSHLTFIGSERVGRLVGVAAASAGIPVVMELGGKDPCIVLESANVDKFCATWMRGAFQAAGQNCIGIERFIVHDKVYDAFVSAVEARVRGLRVGDYRNAHTDVGAMMSEGLLDRVEALIAEAVAQGATLVVGGKRARPEEVLGYGGISPEVRSFFEPTLITGVRENMRIAQEELFAPVMVVMRAGSAAEAVRIANGTRYGLGASVFGGDAGECRAVARDLEAGMVSVNDFGAFYLNQELPFGGVKGSGFGRFAGVEGLRGLCSAKVVMMDRLHGVVETTIPPVLAYPIADGVRAFAFVRGLVRVVYGRWSECVGGLRGLAGV